MKNNILLTLLAMLLPLCETTAATELSIEPFEIKAGESKNMVVDLTNPSDEITLVQFDLSLPSGLTLKKNNNEYDIDIAGRTTWRKHSLEGNQTEGIIRFLLASTSNTTLSGTSGAIITMGLSASSSFKGGDVMLKNILLVTPEGKEIKQPDYTYYVKETAAPKLELAATPAGGTVARGTVVKLTVSSSGSTISGADILYTTDGNDPATRGTKYTSSGITINSSCTLKAIASKTGYDNSEILSVSYTVTAVPDYKDGDTFTAMTEEGASLIYTVISAANKTCEVTQNSNYGDGTHETKTTKVTIPSKVNGYSVVSIGRNAFRYWIALKTVTIPNSVTSIGAAAFSGCSSLASITIPNSVTSIGTAAFSGCSSLASITIPNSVTSIERYAFDNCSSLTSIIIPSSVTKFDYNPFYGCSSLISIKVDSSNNKYDSRNNCNAIIETSTNTLISGCKNTKIPNSVTSIHRWAFCECGLTSITIPNSVMEIGSNAFYGCYGLTIITIPNSVTKIGNYAFMYCYGLTSITLPNSLTEIGNKAFDGCTHLTDVYCYAQNVPNTPSNAFQDSNISNAILHVPASSLNAYKAAEPWKNFKNIVELEGISSSAELSIEPFDIKAGESKNMVVDLTNPSDEITLVQFDLSLPSGLTLKKNNDEYDIDIAGRTTWRKHSLEANHTEGVIRFLLASTSNATLSGTSGAIITMALSANSSFKGGDVMLKNILLVTPDGKEIKQPDYILQGPTAISTITKDEQENTVVYNMSGQRQSGIKKGLNIINGKKIMKK